MTEAGTGLPAAASWPEEGAWPSPHDADVTWPDHQEVETVQSWPRLRLVDELGPDDDLPLDGVDPIDLRAVEDVP